MRSKYIIIYKINDFSVEGKLFSPGWGPWLLRLHSHARIQGSRSTVDFTCVQRISVAFEFSVAYTQRAWRTRNGKTHCTCTEKPTVHVRCTHAASRTQHARNVRTQVKSTVRCTHAASRTQHARNVRTQVKSTVRCTHAASRTQHARNVRTQVKSTVRYTHAASRTQHARNVRTQVKSTVRGTHAASRMQHEHAMFERDCTREHDRTIASTFVHGHYPRDREDTQAPPTLLASITAEARRAMANELAVRTDKGEYVGGDTIYG